MGRLFRGAAVGVLFLLLWSQSVVPALVGAYTVMLWLGLFLLLGFFYGVLLAVMNHNVLLLSAVAPFILVS